MLNLSILCNTLKKEGRAFRNIGKYNPILFQPCLFSFNFTTAKFSKNKTKQTNNREVKHDFYVKRQTAGWRLPFAVRRFEFLGLSVAYTRKGLETSKRAWIATIGNMAAKRWVLHETSKKLKFSDL